ncbi:MAG: S8 family serine peptidase [Pseudomonadota bacterium]|nr:S8 family serine peptidase [Pseudomonadota bacterium]
MGPLDADRLGAGIERLPAIDELRKLRLAEVGELLRRHRDVLEADPRGAPVVRRELLAWSPSTAGLAAARAAGLAIAREEGFDGALRLVVLRVPDDADTAATLARLRALDPDGVYDFNHLYTGSGSGALPAAAAAAATGAGVTAPAGAAPAGAPKVGLVDSGIDVGHVVFRDAAIARWGCAGVAHPSAHGTAVAALMVGKSARFQGGAPGAALYAADIYCDGATGGSADKIVGALAWLAREHVAVINLSLVGPPNATLERVVGAMVRGGYLLVAAVGNDGPAAPPLYPASYPGVVGVSAVDRQGRALPEAARGPQVMFAAPGNNMLSAAPGAPPFQPVRGTSFAAPLVAALLAGKLAQPDQAKAAAALAALARQAGDGASVSNATGYGIVGAALRVDPAGFRQ